MEKKLILPESWWPPGVSYRMPWMYCSRDWPRFTPQLGSGVSEVNSQMSDCLLMPVHQCPTPKMSPASLLEEAELKGRLWVWGWAQTHSGCVGHWGHTGEEKESCDTHTPCRGMLAWQAAPAGPHDLLGPKTTQGDRRSMAANSFGSWL